MARPQRHSVDYFPFYCEEGKKMYYLEETYGNDGFAVFVKILRELAKTDYHYLDLSSKTTLMFLSAKCKVKKDVLEAIIDDLVDLDKFDEELWSESRIIWCQDFIDSIQDAYSKRANNCIDRIALVHLLQAKGVWKPQKSNRKPQNGASDSPVNPQSIVEYSKEKERKEKKSIASLSPQKIEDDYKKQLLLSIDSPKIKETDNYQIAIAFHSLFVKNLSELGINNSSLEKAKGIWVDHIRMMIDIDKRTPEEIREVFDFLKVDVFWKENIRSTSKLREKFETLLIKSRKNEFKKPTPNDTRDGAELKAIIERHTVGLKANP